MKTSIDIATILYLQKKAKSSSNGFDKALLNLGVSQKKKRR